MDNIKFARHREKFIGIKTIEDETCEDTTNRYPVNDGVLHTPLLWRIFNFLIGIFAVIGLPLLIAYSLIAFLWKWLKWLMFGFFNIWLAAGVLNSIASIFVPPFSVSPGQIAWAIFYGVLIIIWNIMFFKYLVDWEFKNIKLPSITYPDCDICDCKEPGLASYDMPQNIEDIRNGTNPNNPSSGQNSGGGGAAETSGLIVSFNGEAISEKLFDEALFQSFFTGSTRDCNNPPTFTWDYTNDAFAIKNVLIGSDVNKRNPGVGYGVPLLQPTYSVGSAGETGSHIWSGDLPFGERINMFNLKSNYYNSSGGWNQIEIQYDPSNQANINKKHNDNVIALLVTPSFLEAFPAGTMCSFVNPYYSNDRNSTAGELNSAGTYSITGISSNINSVNISYANPNSRIGNLSVNYSLTPNTGDTSNFYRYNSDIEYFQIITGYTITEFKNLSNNNPNLNSFAGIINGTVLIEKFTTGEFCNGCGGRYEWGVSRLKKELKVIDLIDQSSVIIFLQRGVDPYSPKYSTKVGLGKLFGFSSSASLQATVDLRLNVPIQNRNLNLEKLMVRHDQLQFNNSVNNGQYLFFPSYHFTPGSYYTGYTTNTHRYYSFLDSDHLNWQIDDNATETLASLWIKPLNVNGTLDVVNLDINNVFFQNNLSNTPKKYIINESLDGGSMIHASIYNAPCHSVPSEYRVNYLYYIGNMGYIEKPDAFNFSRIYSSGITVSMNDKNRIVMRSDRLPSSSTIKNFGVGSPLQNYDNTPLLQQNPRLSMSFYNDDGVVNLGGTPNQNNQFNTDDFDPGRNNFFENVLNTFSCEGMVDLNCYTGNGLNFGVDAGCTQTDAVENGCYVFVNKPLFGLFKPKGNNDITNWAEYVSRFRFTYALCQGVLSTVFNNNWINGNLYSFPFKINTYYNKLNQVKFREYPLSLVVLQEEVNNFYYRSSPYKNGKFVGASFSNSGTDGANQKNIKYPTTIMNLGPKNDLLKFLILNSNYYGYVMDKLNPTSYNDLSDLINFFSVIRIINQKFLSSLVTVQPLFKLFSRKGFKVDADFAQSSAINSQLGVIPFDSDYYSTGGYNPSVFAVGPAQLNNADNIMMGIFYDSSVEDIQDRDYISPGRIIRYNQLTQSFVYDYIPIKSQKVPFYKWNIATGGNSIFGVQKNEWDTNLSGGTFFAERYQSLDRINSPYPKVGSLSYEYNMRGYLFGVYPSITLTSPPLVVGEYYTIMSYTNGDDFTNVGAISNAAGETFEATGTTPTLWTTSVLETLPRYYSGNTVPVPNPALGGSPWYFYFGLRKGETALNRFYTQYIGGTDIND